MDRGCAFASAIRKEGPLVSLLWRLRRATTMETGLFEMQADEVREFRQVCQIHPDSRNIFYAMFARAGAVDADPDRASHGLTTATEAVPSSEPEPVDRAAELARCFLRLRKSAKTDLVIAFAIDIVFSARKTARNRSASANFGYREATVIPREAAGWPITRSPESASSIAAASRAAREP